MAAAEQCATSSQWEPVTPLMEGSKRKRFASIQNCVAVCPKGLNPTKAIGHIRSALFKQATNAGKSRGQG